MYVIFVTYRRGSLVSQNKDTSHYSKLSLDNLLIRTTDRPCLRLHTVTFLTSYLRWIFP